MSLVTRFIALSLLASPLCIAKPLEYSAVKEQNPLKGFVPFTADYDDSAFPHSMEFFYIPLKDLMKAPNTYDWTSMERQLQEIASRRHQVVFRVYLDYPKSDVGVPDFIIRGQDGKENTADDLKMYDYDHYGNQKSRSPDYSHPYLRSNLLAFISELGKRYDGDPRIAFIKLGLLGFWGEWHCYPYNGDEGKPNFYPSDEVQEEILQAYQKAFCNTQLLVREPKAAFFKKYSVGYHDDSFVYQTLSPPSWHFEGRLAEQGELERWKTNVIAGEIRPELQPEMWENPQVVPKGQEYDLCVSRIHPTWMLAAAPFHSKLSPKARKLAEEQSRKLGYEFFISSASIAVNSEKKELSIAASLRNTGVAPFYYDWQVEMGYLDANKKLVHTEKMDWKITGLLPGEANRKWSHNTSLPAALKGDHQVILRIVNPMENGLPLHFANQSQNKHLMGWMSLGEVKF